MRHYYKMNLWCVGVLVLAVTTAMADSRNGTQKLPPIPPSPTNPTFTGNSGNNINPSAGVAPSGSGVSPSGIGVAPSGIGVSPSGIGVAPNGIGVSPGGIGINPQFMRSDDAHFSPNRGGSNQSQITSFNNVTPATLVYPWWYNNNLMWGGYGYPLGYGYGTPTGINNNLYQTATLGKPSPADVMDMASAQMKRIEQQLQAQFEASPACIDAHHELINAQFAYDMARGAARAELIFDPQYKAALARRTAAQNKVDDIDAQRLTVPMAEAEDAATEKLQANTALEHLRSALENDNPRVTQALQRLDTARAHLTQLQEQFNDTLKFDLRWQAAKKQYDAAKAAIAGTAEP